METNTNYSVPVVTNRNQGKELIPGRAAAVDMSVPMPKYEASEVDINAKLAEAQVRREQTVRQVANMFIISDKRFTIYKDVSGQFVTRFTSLRDGKVTYIPEPDMLAWMNQSGHNVGSSLSLEV